MRSKTIQYIINVFSAAAGAVAIALVAYGLLYIFVFKLDKNQEQSIQQEVNNVTTDLASFLCAPNQSPSDPACAKKTLTRILKLDRQFNFQLNVAHLSAERECLKKRRASRQDEPDYVLNELVNNPFGPGRGTVSSPDDPICR